MLKKSNTKSRVIVVMPAYNAAKTLKKTFNDLPKDIVSEVILVDDKSSDNTVAIAKQLGITVITHNKNLGYGGNQKTCYKEALARRADIVVMIHPDYQYDATQVGALIAPIQMGKYDMMFGSRIRTRQEALNGGMPLIKYFFNRIFCIAENIILGANFTEYFSGMRAYSKKFLMTISYDHFSDDFVFDQQCMLVGYALGFRIGEINIPVRYFSESSSIHFTKGAKFLSETAFLLVRFLLFKLGYTDKLFIITKR